MVCFQTTEQWTDLPWTDFKIIDFHWSS